jgi:hypothetical protein
MKSLVLTAGLFAAMVMLAPTDADAKKKSKTRKSPQVAGFLQVGNTNTNGAGLLRSYERGRQFDRVAGNDPVARFFSSQRTDGGP